MGLHQAKTAIAASAEEVWGTVTDPNCLLWPENLQVRFGGAPEVGSDVQTHVNVKGFSISVLSRIVECDPPYSISTELVSIAGLLVPPDAANTVIRGREERGITLVSIEVDLVFNGMKRFAGRVLELTMDQELQRGLNQMKANFEKAYKL
jgi:hypothetical protein